ncbi:hypothetical protein TrRE_jg7707, partial [Triparma retinervis]
MSALSSPDPSPLPTSVNTLDVTSWSSFSQYNIKYNSVHSMVAEHVWEHLGLEDAIHAARNCRFALEPGGVLLVAVPDANSYAGALGVDAATGDAFSHPMNRADIRDGHTTQYNYKLLLQVFLSGGWEQDEVRIVEGHDESGVLRLDYPEPRYPINIKRCHANGRTGPGSSLILQLVKRLPSTAGREPYHTRESCRSQLGRGRLPQSLTPLQITLLARCFKSTADPSYIEPLIDTSESLELPQIAASLKAKVLELTSTSPVGVYSSVMARFATADELNDGTMLWKLNQHALLTSTLKGARLFDEWRIFRESLVAVGQPREALRLLKRVALEKGEYGDGEMLRMMKEASSMTGGCDGNEVKVLLNGESLRQNFKSTEPIRVEIDMTCMANTPLQNPNAGIIPCSYLVSNSDEEPERKFRNCSPLYTLSSLPRGSHKIVVAFYSQPDYEEIAGSEVEVSFDVDVFSAAAAALNTTFQWHVVEGVAEGRADASNPYSREEIKGQWRSSRNLSTDGSSQVLDELQALHPGKVFVHRRPDWSAFRDKVQMVNEVAYSLDFECVLMQVDVDEIWSSSMIEKAYGALVGSTRNCAYFDCHFLVGPEIVTTAGTGGWGHGSAEWLRAWKFQPLSFFLSHAPPVLFEEEENGWKAVEDCVGKEETTEMGIVFSHYAYFEEKQAEFKSLFYGYGEEGVEGWRGLQQAAMPQKAGKWLPWLRKDAKGYEERFEETMVDKVEVMEEKLGVEVVKFGREDVVVSEGGGEKFGGGDEGRECAYSTVIDGVIFQVTPHGGISRVWREVLGRISSVLPPSHCVVVILRGGEGEELVSRAINVVGGRSNWKLVNAPLYKEGEKRDSIVLSSLCERYSARWFFSTLYTFPAKELSPKVKVGLLVHDVTPEMFHWKGAIWEEKAEAISRASDAIVVVSNRTGDKLREHYDLREGVEVVRSSNGVDTGVFYRRGAGEVGETKRAVGLVGSEKYVLLVGERRGYKNGHALLLTLKWAKDSGAEEVPVVVMVGGGE